MCFQTAMDSPDEPLIPDTDQQPIIVQRTLAPATKRLFRTICMMACYVCVGLYVGTLSPATLDLLDLFGCSMQHLSWALAAKAVGIMMGSLSGGLALTRLARHTDLCLAVITITAGLLNAAVPWCPNLPVVALVLALQGLLQGTNNVVCSAMTIAEWKEKAPSPVNALHFAYSLGLLLAPPITAPFLSRTKHNTSGDVTSEGGNPELTKGDWLRFTDNSMYYSAMSSVPLSNMSNTTVQILPTRVYIPFAFQGGLGLIVGLVFLGFYISEWTYKSTKAGAEENPRDDIGSTTHTALAAPARPPFTFKVIMAVGLFLCYVAIVNRENALNAFVFYIAVRSPVTHMSKQRAAVYNTVYFGSWVAGRLLGTFVARWVKIHYLVIAGMVLAIADTILLIFFGLQSELLFWILTCALGILTGPAYASVMSWADRYVEVRGVFIGILDIGIGTGCFLSMYLGGYLVDHADFKYIFVLAAAAAGLFAVVFIPLQLVCWAQGDRFNNILRSPSTPRDPHKEQVSVASQLDASSVPVVGPVDIHVEEDALIVNQSSQDLQSPLIS